MAPLFNRLLSIDDVQKRVGQFRSEVEKLLLQEGSAKLTSCDMHNLQRRCVDLKKHIDGYIKKAEAMKVDVKNAGTADLKEQLLQQLYNLSDDLAVLVNPNHVRKASRIIGETVEQEVDDDDREDGQNFAGNVDESSKGDRSEKKASNVEENGSGSINDEQQNQHQNEESPVMKSSRDGVLIGDNLFRVIADFQAEQQSDLSVKAGEMVTIHATRKDGWWMAEKSDGKRGLVPKTFLKVYSKTRLPTQQHLLAEDHKATAASSSASPSSQEEKKILAQNYAGDMGIHQKNDGQVEQNVVLRDAEVPESVSTMPATNAEERMRSMPEKMTEQKKAVQRFPRIETCLGAAVSSDTHLSYRCHFAPRLSESNIGFHDLYWNYERNMLRKRRVRVSKIFRLLHLQNIPTNISGVHCRLIRICLFDLTGRTGRQVVSNVHTIKAQAKPHMEQTWTFISKTDGEHSSIEFSDFFVRSNYIQTDVVILIEVSVVHNDANAKLMETSLGYAALPIIGDSGHCCLQNKTYTRTLLSGNFFEKNSTGSIPKTTQIKLALRVSDVNEAIVSFVDSLPDILIWNPMFARLGFYYRRSLGEVLLKQRGNPMSGELICDPFLATFPIVAEQLDVMDLVRSLWMEKLKSYSSRKREEWEEAAHFREFYVKTAFVLCDVIPMPKFDLLDPHVLAERSAILKAFKEQYVTISDPLKYLSTCRCKPVDIFGQVVDLIGRHAID
uniref:SH3 domain-containing protein n=1 Tax=Parascaris univalens TaxID=6257 RepID=A0A915BZQ5_PARUN